MFFRKGGQFARITKCDHNSIYFSPAKLWLMTWKGKEKTKLIAKFVGAHKMRFIYVLFLQWNSSVASQRILKNKIFVVVDPDDVSLIRKSQAHNVTNSSCDCKREKWKPNKCQ